MLPSNTADKRMSSNILYILQYARFTVSTDQYLQKLLQWNVSLNPAAPNNVGLIFKVLSRSAVEL